VFALCVHDADGAGPGVPKLIVGGSFTSAGGIVVNRIASWDLTGRQWEALGTGVGGVPLATVTSLASVPNAAGGFDLVAAGNFNTAGGINASGVARWDGHQWHAMGVQLGIADLAFSPATGELHAGGASGIQKWTGTQWVPVATPPGAVTAMAINQTGDIFVGGDWSVIFDSDGVPRVSRRLAWWTGLSWRNMKGGVNGTSVFDLELTADGKVVVGGVFGSVGSPPDLPAQQTVVYNPNLGYDLPTNGFGSWESPGALNNSVNALLVMPSGAVVVGGTMTRANSGQDVIANVCYLRGPDESIFDFDLTLSGGTNGTVNALARLPDGDIIVAGGFTTAGTASAVRIARYSFAVSPPFIDAHPASVSACPGDDVTLIVTPASGSDRPLFAWRRNGVPIDRNLNPTAVTSALVLTDLDATATYACLLTNSCGSTLSLPATITVIARCGTSDIAGAGPVVASCGDGELTADDIIQFISWFAAGDARADVAGPGPVAGPDAEFTADDVILFLNAFTLGC
jgi:hypothetical protein